VTAAAAPRTPRIAPALDVAAIRRDFPILATKARGHDLVYLDSAATSQKPRQVIEALTDFYATSCANVHRSVHYLAERATTRFEEARARVARFVGAAQPEQVIWTRGTTEAINLVANAWGERNLRPGDVVLVTEMEHHSNLVPWHLLAKRRGLRVRAVPVTEDGELDAAAAFALLEGPAAERPKLFAFTAKSNVLGSSPPTEELCRRARAAGCVTVVDGAQAVPHGPVDVRALGCDFFAFSSHKALGPMGVGCLVVGREELWAAMDPWQGGGEMIRRVRIDESTYAEPPLRWEAGTPSAADAIAFVAAMDYLERTGPAAIHAHEVRLTALALELLGRVGVRILGPADPERRAGIVAFDVEGAHPHDVAALLDSRGIAVRAGHHCAQPLMRRFGVQATTRASFYLYNTEDEVRALADGVRAAMEYFRR
jgi:cysteine desulfurase / selenocysteine lyase